MPKGFNTVDKFSQDTTNPVTIEPALPGYEGSKKRGD